MTTTTINKSISPKIHFPFRRQLKVFFSLFYFRKRKVEKFFSLYESNIYTIYYPPIYHHIAMMISTPLHKHGKRSARAKVFHMLFNMMYYEVLSISLKV